MTQITPAQAWAEMQAGNERFVAGTPRHPHQDAMRRLEVSAAQYPHAMVFGCSDSRLAAEIIFDEGLGDVFVIRNAGQVISESVIGSLEYGVAALGIPLIVVLGHDACGAVAAAIDAVQPSPPELPMQVWRQIAPIVPAVHRVMKSTDTTPETVSPEEVGRDHLRATVSGILNASELINEAVNEGKVAIVAANYRLTEGTAVPHFSVGAANADA